MIYDTFMFFDELDMLEIRMNILDSVTDYFVITEADTTLVGTPKRMIFKDNEERYSKFRKKIIYHPIHTAGMVFEDQWNREAYQKNACIHGLQGCKDEDIIIFSDLDEIPNPDKVVEITKNFNTEIIYHFAQEMFYFYLNYKNIDGSLLAACGEFPGIKQKKWLGSKACSYRVIRETGCDNIRHKEAIQKNSVRVMEGGWHFTYMGGSKRKVQDRVKAKLAAFSHSEYNKWIYYNKASIWLSILTGRDLLGRGAKFKKVPIDKSYPQWLIDHYRDYPHLVL